MIICICMYVRKYTHTPSIISNIKNQKLKLLYVHHNCHTSQKRLHPKYFIFIHNHMTTPRSKPRATYKLHAQIGCDKEQMSHVFFPQNKKLFIFSKLIFIIPLHTHTHAHTRITFFIVNTINR